MPRRTYKKIDFSRPHRGRRRKWKDMEILKIKLNPEQAVLTCCATPGKGTTYPGHQCSYEGCPGGLGEDFASS